MLYNNFVSQFIIFLQISKCTIQTRRDVYHTLRILLEETEQKTFEVLLQKAIFQWENDEQLK